MIPQTTDRIEKARSNHPWNSEMRGQLYGEFIFPYGDVGLHCVVSAGDPDAWFDNDGTPLPPPRYEHVSVSILGSQEPPTWAMMCFIKDIFWLPTECVVQYHPAKDDYVNIHPGVLHLWKLSEGTFPMPPKVCV